MVAISLYRGNLHRVPDAPRQWPMPRRALTLEQFRILTRKRDQSLARLAARRNSNPSDKKDEEGGEVTDCSGLDPQPIKVEDESKAAAEDCEMIDANSNENSKEKALNVDAIKGLEVEMADANSNENSKEKALNVDSVKGLEVEMPDVKVEMVKANANENTSNDDDAVKGAEMRMNDAKVEESNALDADKERRKIELEKKLEVLKQKKHHLVQMLKQILNAEEEIKRRNAQSAALRASIPPQTEAAVDMGSATRHVPKLSVEVNFGGDLGAEPDPTASHSAHGRQMHYMHSTSPSGASLTKPPFQQNTLLPTTKSSLATSGVAAAAGPSGLAPPASSPSPAASGGASSSALRDSRLISPS